MIAKKIYIYGIIVCSAISLAALSGCTRNERTADKNARSGDEKREEVVSRQVTPLDQQSENGVKHDDKEVQARQETVTKKTETLSEKVPTVVSGQEKLDINRMGADDFVALGLDRPAADRIIERRDQRGSFASINDLSGIEGVNPEWLNRYRDRFAFVPKDAEKRQQAGESTND